MPRRPQRDKPQPDGPRRRPKAAGGKKQAAGTPRPAGGKAGAKRRKESSPLAPVREAQPPVADTIPAAGPLPTPASTPPPGVPAPPAEEPHRAEPLLDYDFSGAPVLLEDLLARHALPAPPKRHWTGASGLLAGLAVAWHWQGAAGLAAAHLNPAATGQWPAQIALAWLAAGLAASTWASLRVQREALDGPPSSAAHTSVPLTATLAGVLVIASVALLNPWREGHGAVAGEFFWTPLCLWFLDAVFVSLLFGPAWAALGWLFGAMAARADAGQGPPGGRLLSPALLGAGGGLLLGLLLARVGLTGERQLLLASLPLFLMAVLSARGSRGGPTTESPATLSPHTATGNLRLFAVSLLAASAAMVLVLGGLRSCCGSEFIASRLASGLALLSIGVTMSLTRLLAGRTQRYDCGMALLAAGLSCALAAVVLARWPGARAAQWLACVAVSVPPAIAMALLLRAAAARHGGPSPTASQAAVALSGAALGILFCEAWAGTALGPIGVWAAGALGLIACGSLVVIHEEERPTWICRLRLAAVFGGLSLAISLLPGTARNWARHTRESRAAVDALPPAWQPDEKRHLLQSICCIGVHPTSLEHWPAGAIAQVEAMPFEQWAWAPPPGSRVQVAGSPAAACLRGSHQRFEIVYQRLDAAESGSEQYTAEWLELLARHVSPGGQLVLEAPASSLSSTRQAVLADTFEHVVGPACSWVRVEQPAGPALILQGWPGRLTWPRGHEGRRLDLLQQARSSGLQVHSLLRRR